MPILPLSVSQSLDDVIDIRFDYPLDNTLRKHVQLHTIVIQKREKIVKVICDMFWERSTSVVTQESISGSTGTTAVTSTTWSDITTAKIGLRGESVEYRPIINEVLNASKQTGINPITQELIPKWIPSDYPPYITEYDYLHLIKISDVDVNLTTDSLLVKPINLLAINMVINAANSNRFGLVS